MFSFSHTIKRRYVLHDSSLCTGPSVDCLCCPFSFQQFALIRNVGNGIQILKEKVVQDNGRADNCLYVCYLTKPYFVQEGRPPFLETAKAVLYPYSSFLQGSVISFDFCEKCLLQPKPEKGAQQWLVRNRCLHFYLQQPSEL